MFTIKVACKLTCRHLMLNDESAFQQSTTIHSIFFFLLGCQIVITTPYGMSSEEYSLINATNAACS